MSQGLLFLAIQLLGLAVVLAWGPVRRPHLACALAFPIGLAVAVVLALVVLTLGLPFRAPTMVLAVGLVLAPAMWATIRRRPSPALLRAAGVWAVGFGAAATALSAVNVALLTYDSHQFVKLGLVIAADASLAPDTLVRLQSWGVFQVVAQSLAAFTQQDFLYALPIVFSGSFVPLFALGLWHGAREVGAGGRQAGLLVALVTLALVTIYMFVRHALYIHTNMAAAVYLFVFAVLFWLAEVSRDPTGLPLAFLGLLGFSLQRVETPAFALLFLVLTVIPSELPRRALAPPILGFAVAIASWFELLARHTPPGGKFLTPALCHLFAGALLGFAAYWFASGWPPLRRLNRWLPAAALTTISLALIAAFALKPDHMVISALHWAENLFLLPYWGLSWYLIALVVVLTLALPRPPFHQVFSLGVGLTLLLILLLAAGRIPYRVSVNDSANRMTLHILPLLFFYIGLKVAPALRRSHGAIDPVAPVPYRPSPSQASPEP